MTLDELAVGEPLVKYKSEALLRSESDEIDAWRSAELKRLDRVAVLTKAVIFGDHDALAKGSGPDISTARSDAAALRIKYAKQCAQVGDKFLSADLVLGNRLAKILGEYSERANAHREDVARSRRFNEALQALPLISVHSEAVN
jgi:hypothetical protein